jgi:hypothetical protein
MDSFKFYFYLLSIVVLVAVIWEAFFLNINVNDQYVFTLVNGITGSTSIIVGLSGAMIGIMLREAKEEKDKKARIFLFVALAVLQIPLIQLWTTYCFLVMGGTWTSLAVRYGLSGLTLAFFVFTTIVIFIAKRLNEETEMKSEKAESRTIETDQAELDKKEQLDTIKGESRKETATDEVGISKEEKQRDKLIYDIILDRYNLEWNSHNELDSKASGLVGFAGVLATLTVGVAQFVPNPSYGPLFYLPSLFFIVTVIFGLFGYGLGKYKTIRPNVFIETYKNKTKTEVLREYVATISEMTMHNLHQNQNKVKWIRLALIFLITAIALSFFITIIIMMA